MAYSFQAILSVVFIPIYYRQLATQEFALLMLLWALFAVTSVLDFGVGRTATRTISAAINDGRLDASSRIGGAAVRLGVALGGVSGVLAAVGFFFYRAASPVSIDSPELILVCAYSFLNIFLNIVIAVLDGLQKAPVASLARMAGASAYIAVPALVLLSGVQLTALDVITVCAVGRLVVVIAAVSYVRHSVGSGEVSFDATTQRMLILSGGWVTVSSISGSLAFYLDRFFVGASVDARSLGSYSLASESTQRASIVFGLISNSLFISLSSREQNGLWWNALYFGVATNAFIAAVGVACVWLWGETLFSMWLRTNDVETIVSFAKLIVVAWAAGGVSQVFLTGLHARGEYALPALLHLGELIVFVPALFLAVKHYGATGAAYTLVGRSIADASLMSWACLRRRNL